jgi:hypothetical protein
MHAAFSCNVNNNICFPRSSSFNYTCMKDTLLIITLIPDFYNSLLPVIFTLHMNKLPSIARIVKLRWLQCVGHVEWGGNKCILNFVEKPSSISAILKTKEWLEVILIVTLWLLYLCVLLPHNFVRNNTVT